MTSDTLTHYINQARLIFIIYLYIIHMHTVNYPINCMIYNNYV